MNDTTLTTKEQIREIALDLFQKHGYENVKIMDICKSAGVTKRTFYYHFTSKNDLLTGITKYLGIKAEQLLASITLSKVPTETFWELMSVYCTNSEKYGANIIKQLYIITLEEGGDADFPFDAHLYPIARQLIVNAQAASEIRTDVPPDELVYTVYHTLRSLSLTWAAQNGSFNLTEEFKKCFKAVLGIQPGHSFSYLED